MQEQFADAIATGSSPTLTAAYIEAGYATTTPKRSSIHVNASQLAANPKVVQRVEEKKADLERRSHVGMIASRRYVLQRLREEADNPDSPANARVAALSLLAKATNALGEAPESDKRSDASDEELAQELEARLAALLPDDDCIDVTESAEKK